MFDGEGQRDTERERERERVGRHFSQQVVTASVTNSSNFTSCAVDIDLLRIPALEGE